MSTITPPASSPTPRHTSSHPTTLALAPYALAAILIAGVVVLLALSKISEQAGVGLLGVIVGGHLVANLGK